MQGCALDCLCLLSQQVSPQHSTGSSERSVVIVAGEERELCMHNTLMGLKVPAAPDAPVHAVRPHLREGACTLLTRSCMVAGAARRVYRVRLCRRVHRGEAHRPLALALHAAAGSRNTPQPSRWIWVGPRAALIENAPCTRLHARPQHTHTHTHATALQLHARPQTTARKGAGQSCVPQCCRRAYSNALVACVCCGRACRAMMRVCIVCMCVRVRVRAAVGSFFFLADAIAYLITNHGTLAGDNDRS